MADKPTTKNLLPTSLTQNPSLVEKPSQDRKRKVREQVELIMATFRQVLPSNYVSQVTGPYYSVQFQAAAEQIADFQITAQEVWADRDYDFTRPAFLFQILGSMVFPDSESDGIPDIDGDLSYRTFLQRMVELLLQGATKATIKEGVELLTDADVDVIEKVIAARQTANSAWGFDDQFSFEINISEEDEDGASTWPAEDPFILSENLRMVMRALKPAHTLYDQRFLFKEAFGTLFDDSSSWEMSNYYYDDLRKWCYGAERLVGTTGATLTDRGLFSDPTRDFENIQVGALLTVLAGDNADTYRVVGLRSNSADETTLRSYTTIPTGLSGTASVSGGVVSDTSQNWALAVEGEQITFLIGLNAGVYRLKTVLGSNGGAVGYATGPGTQVRLSQSILQIERRMPKVATSQSYEVTVDRLGVQIPYVVTGEDASSFFYV